VGEGMGRQGRGGREGKVRIQGGKRAEEGRERI